MFATFPRQPGPLGAVIARATQADPRKRYASAAEMRAALDGKGPRRRWPLLVGVLLAVLLLTWWSWPRESIPIVTLPVQPTLSLREDVQQEKIYEVYVRLLGQLDRYAASRGVKPVGAPFTRYHVWNPPRHIAMEVGLTFAAPVPGSGAIQAGSLPGGPAAMVVHRGDYSGLGTEFARLEKWVRHRHPAGPPWYVWVVTEGDSASWVTEIYWPLQAP